MVDSPVPKSNERRRTRIHEAAQVWSRFAPWTFYVAAPTAAWYSFGWWSDEWKKILTLGIYEPPSIHWDYCMSDSGMRSHFVKYHAQYAGIPYK